MSHGSESWVTFIEESVYGTDPSGARDVNAYMISDGMKLNPSNKHYPGMRGPGRSKMFQGYKRVAGPVSLEMYYEGALPFLLKHAMGTVNTTGAGPYVHEIQLASDLPVGFSMEINKADIPTGKVFLYEGCKVDTLALEFGPEEMGILEVGILAQNRTTNVTATDAAPTFPPDEPVLYSHFGASISVAGLTLNIRRLAIQINNNLDKDRFFMSRDISEPLRKGFREITGSGIVDFTDVQIPDALAAATEGDMTAIITDGTGILLFEGTVANNAKTIITDGEPVVNSEGVLELPFEFQFLSDAGTEELEVTVTNNQTTIP